MKDIDKLMTELTWEEQVEVYNRVKHQMYLNQVRHLVERYCEEEEIPKPDISDEDYESYVMEKEWREENWDDYYADDEEMINIADFVLQFVDDQTEEETY